jgi:hypothetical protein
VACRSLGVGGPVCCGMPGTASATDSMHSLTVAFDEVIALEKLSKVGTQTQCSHG